VQQLGMLVCVCMCGYGWVNMAASGGKDGWSCSPASWRSAFAAKVPSMRTLQQALDRYRGIWQPTIEEMCPLVAMNPTHIACMYAWVSGWVGMCGPYRACAAS